MRDDADELVAVTQDATPGAAVGHVHRVAEVISEVTVMATGYGEPEPVIRLLYRASGKNAPELDRMLARFAHFKLDDLAGDGALTPAALAKTAAEGGSFPPSVQE